MKSHIVFDYSQITDHIFIGTNFCCQAHFNEELVKKGVNADISLEENSESPLGVNSFLWLPTKDEHSPTQQQLLLGSVAIDLLIETGNKIYVHCRNGHGRAPTLVAAYFISQGKPLKEAIELVKSKRSEIHLNKEQTEALKMFEKGEIKKTPCNC